MKSCTSTTSSYLQRLMLLLNRWRQKPECQIIFNILTRWMMPGCGSLGSISTPPLARNNFMITTVLSFIVVLGFLIFIHELGHYLAARHVNVRVETFSIGFPPKMTALKGQQLPDLLDPTRGTFDCLGRTSWTKIPTILQTMLQSPCGNASIF